MRSASTCLRQTEAAETASQRPTNLHPPCVRAQRRGGAGAGGWPQAPAHALEDDSNPSSSHPDREHPLRSARAYTIEAADHPAQKEMTASKVLTSSIVGAALATGVCNHAATAGTYEVLSCAAAAGVNRAWTATNEDPASLRIEDSCGQVSGGAEDGLSTSDRIPGPPGTPSGREAFWRVIAPAGTRITRLTAQYYLGQFSAGE